MSTDNGPNFGSDIPVAGISNVESNNKRWMIFGGLGCLGLIGLVCVGFILMGVFAAKPMLDFMNESVTFIESSEPVSYTHLTLPTIYSV